MTVDVMTLPQLELSSDQILRLLAKTEMREFTRSDWDAWAGCESKKPMIGEISAEAAEVPDQPDGVTIWIIILDFSVIGVYRLFDGSETPCDVNWCHLRMEGR